jgi:hypothetical protein
MLGKPAIKPSSSNYLYYITGFKDSDVKKQNEINPTNPTYSIPITISHPALSG